MSVAVLTAATLLATAGPSSGQPTEVRSRAVASSTSARPTTDPVTPVVREYPVVGISRAGLQALGTGPARAARGYAALSAPRPASGFAVTGATWRGRAPRGLTLAVRTRTDGTWSAWTAMVSEDDHGPTPDSAEAERSIPGTDPFVVGAVDAVQLRADSASGRAPKGLRLAVIDPGATTTSLRPVAPATSDANPAAGTAPAGGAPMPDIHTRADWGADESLRDCCVEYGTIRAGFVHHTVNANDYSRSDVPAIIRGIYAYHTQSRGWRDIGYNFLIDRFGGIWEGRYGGMSKAVVGAHTLYYNEYSFAASAIGNYDLVEPSDAMLESFARLYAWKLGLYDISPTSRQTLGSTTFDAISGHRDAAQTACPGAHLYAKIGWIIRQAAAYQSAGPGGGGGGSRYRHSFVDTRHPDVLLLAKRSGRVSIARGTGAPGFGRIRTADADFEGLSHVAAVGDVTGDGLNDVMARDPATGITTTFRGRGAGGFAVTRRSTDRWAGTDLFAGVGDIDGDGLADVLARDRTTGELLFYPAVAPDRFSAPRVAVQEFGRIDRLSSAGDFDGDGERDILARDTRGALFVYLGDGTGHFPDRVTLADDWSSKGLISGGADVTGDGRPDVVARSSATKVLKIFANVAGRGLSSALGSLTAPMSSLNLTDDVTGDELPDLLITSARGRLSVVTGRRQNWVTPPRRRPSTWAGADRVLVVGDWNGDGKPDAMTRSRRTGRLELHPGLAKGGFGDATVGWDGWGSRSLLTAVGDLDHDGRPDLMAQSPDGRVYLYPGRGTAAFGKRVPMAGSLPAGSIPVAVGRWDRDDDADVLVATEDGRILLYPGNGKGGLRAAVRVGTGLDRFTTLLGIGDATGDARPDVLGRTASGDVYLIPSRPLSPRRPHGGFAEPEYVGSGWSRYLMG